MRFCATGYVFQRTKLILNAEKRVVSVRTLAETRRPRRFTSIAFFQIKTASGLKAVASGKSFCATQVILLIAFVEKPVVAVTLATLHLFPTLRLTVMIRRRERFLWMLCVVTRIVIGCPRMQYGTVECVSRKKRLICVKKRAESVRIAVWTMKTQLSM